MTGQCLNCSNAVRASYCENCGQKTTTHRFSLKHIFSHDFVHGVFHLDKGLLYTVRELLVRPGHSIREYIEGKRVRHFNYFTLILLILTLGVVLEQFTPVNPTDIFESVRSNEDIVAFMEMIREYPKVFVLATIPLYAIFSWVFFRKAQLNFAEHLVLNSYRAAGELLFSLSFNVIMIFVHDLEVLKVVNIVLTIIVPVYSTIFYYQFFSAHSFRRAGLFFRSLFASLALNFIVMITTTVFLILTRQ